MNQAGSYTVDTFASRSWGIPFLYGRIASWIYTVANNFFAPEVATNYQLLPLLPKTTALKLSTQERNAPDLGLTRPGDISSVDFSIAVISRYSVQEGLDV